MCHCVHSVIAIVIVIVYTVHWGYFLCTSTEILCDCALLNKFGSFLIFLKFSRKRNIVKIDLFRFPVGTS